MAGQFEAGSRPEILSSPTSREKKRDFAERRHLLCKRKCLLGHIHIMCKQQEQFTLKSVISLTICTQLFQKNESYNYFLVENLEIVLLFSNLYEYSLVTLEIVFFSILKLVHHLLRVHEISMKQDRQCEIGVYSLCLLFLKTSSYFTGVFIYSAMMGITLG